MSAFCVSSSLHPLSLKVPLSSRNFCCAMAMERRLRSHASSSDRSYAIFSSRLWIDILVVLEPVAISHSFL